MQKLILTMLLCFFVLGCQTVEKAGIDLEETGEEIQKFGEELPKRIEKTLANEKEIDQDVPSDAANRSNVGPQ